MSIIKILLYRFPFTREIFRIVRLESIYAYRECKRLESHDFYRIYPTVRFYFNERERKDE